MQMPGAIVRCPQRLRGISLAYVKIQSAFPDDSPLTQSSGGHLVSCFDLLPTGHRSQEDIQTIAMASMGTGHPRRDNVHLLDRRGRNIEIELQRLLQGMLGLAWRDLEWFVLCLWSQ